MGMEIVLIVIVLVIGIFAVGNTTKGNRMESYYSGAEAAIRMVMREFMRSIEREEEFLEKLENKKGTQREVDVVVIRRALRYYKMLVDASRNASSSLCLKSDIPEEEQLFRFVQRAEIFSKRH